MTTHHFGLFDKNTFWQMLYYIFDLKAELQIVDQDLTLWNLT